MDITLTVIIVMFWSNYSTVGYSSNSGSENPLNGQHFRVIWPLWSGNPKGMLGPLKGGVALDYLAARLNFTYEMVPVTENRLEPTGKEKGLFNYLWDQKADFLIQDVVQTFDRHKFVDLTVPWIFGSFALLVAVQDDTANIDAVIKPFQWPIWLGLAIAVVCVIFVLNLLQRCYAYHSPSQTTPTSIEFSDTNPNLLNNRRAPLIGQQYLYVLGNLLSQGVPDPSNRLSYRLVAGVWSLAAFIFVQAYTSTLITYVVTPVNPPLVSSAYDLVDKKDINVLVRKSGAIDTMFSNPDNSKLLGRTLRDRINSFPQSRCRLTSECVKLLFPGSRNIFIDGTAYLMDAIREDFNKTRKCNLLLLKDAIVGSTVEISLIALPKNSKYTKTISKAMLELIQTGIIDHWDLWFRPMPLQCLPNFKSVYKPQNSKTLKMKNNPPALSLKNLTGAFIVLVFGFSISLLAFLVEQIVSMPERHRQRLQRARNKVIVKHSSKIDKKEDLKWVLLEERKRAILKSNKIVKKCLLYKREF